MSLLCAFVMLHGKKAKIMNKQQGRTKKQTQ